MKKFILTTILSFALAGFAAAQSPKGAEQLRTQKAPAEKPATIVDGRFQLLSSHIKSLGTIGKTGRYTIVSVKLRGLAEPNVSALLAYNSETDTLGTIASGVEPGIGVAIVNGGATVGGNFLFGAKIRPDRTNVSNDSASKSNSEGSSARSSSESEGGSAVSVSSSDADATARNSNSNTSVNSNSNRNSNEQSQGQIQGQQQGQSSVNQNVNSNTNPGKGPKPPKAPKPPKHPKHGND